MQALAKLTKKEVVGTHTPNETLGHKSKASGNTGGRYGRSRPFIGIRPMGLLTRPADSIRSILLETIAKEHSRGRTEETSGGRDMMPKDYKTIGKALAECEDFLSLEDIEELILRLGRKFKQNSTKFNFDRFRKHVFESLEQLEGGSIDVDSLAGQTSQSGTNLVDERKKIQSTSS